MLIKVRLFVLLMVIISTENDKKSHITMTKRLTPLNQRNYRESTYCNATKEAPRFFLILVLLDVFTTKLQLNKW